MSAGPGLSGPTMVPERDESWEPRFEPAGAQPGGAPSPQIEGGTGRVARLTLASFDLWSVLKVSLMLSVAAAVALVVSAVALWLMLRGIGVFDQLNGVFGDLGSEEGAFDIYDYVGFGRVLSFSLLIGVVDVFILTALGTVAALLYNLSAGLVGGVRVTLSDE